MERILMCFCSISNHGVLCTLRLLNCHDKGSNLESFLNESITPEILWNTIVLISQCLYLIPTDEKSKLISIVLCTFAVK